jgi:hypothetical protein
MRLVTIQALYSALLYILKKTFNHCTVGYFNLPDMKNVALNKYGLPSYVQTDIHYEFQDLKVFDTQLLALFTNLMWVKLTVIKLYVFNKTNARYYQFCVNF